MKHTPSLSYSLPSMLLVTALCACGGGDETPAGTGGMAGATQGAGGSATAGGGTAGTSGGAAGTTTSGGATGGGGAAAGGTPSGGAGGGGAPAGGSPAGGGGTQAPMNIPTDITAEAFTAFLDAETYKGAEWTPESPAAREAATGVSPHGVVRVYVNDVAVQAFADGHGGLADQVPYVQYSMSVKEIYDETDMTTVLGKAIMYKTADAGNDTWVYYCYGPAARCSSSSGEIPKESAMFVMGSSNDCASCHGGNLFAVPQ